MYIKQMYMYSEWYHPGIRGLSRSYKRETKAATAVQIYLTLCEKVIAPLINYELTIIKHIYWNIELNFSSHTEAWLLPHTLNQEITFK